MSPQKKLWGIARLGWLSGYGLLAFLWGVHAEWAWAALAVILGGLSIVSSYGSRTWLGSLHFLALLVLSGVATVWNSWIALCSVLSGVSAWDLELFARRLEPFSDPPREIVRTHLKRLGAIALLSGILGAIALSLPVSLGFGWILLVAFGFLLVFSLLLRQGLL
ncbi:MAG: hypothetical protein NZ930_04110 [Candidatus Bipolaricaulota bacterium]|nr:hypothetical protein [Candidatus Bipolaricaulota bacterium]MDW8031365.1 hypothetical protein [Candidatus Bipolaricaulota bacterium]